MELNLNYLLIHIFFTVTLSTPAPRCSLHCGPGESCALVRTGHGPAVPDCISSAEALLLQQALQGGPTGPGTGITGHFGGGLHGGFIGGRPGFIGQPGGFLDPTSSGAVPVGPPVGIGVNPPTAGVINARPGGGPIVIDDGRRNLTININVQNTNINQHDSSGGGGTQVNTGAAGCVSCLSAADCPPAEYCYFSPTCAKQVCQKL